MRYTVFMKTNNEINDLIASDETLIGNSYKWDNLKSKSTFPSTLWVSAILDIIYFELPTTEVEKKYTEKMPTIKRPSNNMYISSLLRKMGILTKPRMKLSSHFSEVEIENWIINRINEITNKYYNETTNGMRKLIDEWRSNQTITTTSKLLDEEKLAETSQELRKRVFLDTNHEWTVLEKLSDNYVELMSSDKFDTNFNSENREKIGRLGESLFNDMLIKKYGAENVNWKSNIDKFSSYDFEVNLNESKHYFEVKTTTKSARCFFISSNELTFRKKVSNWSLVAITNMPTLTFSHFPNVVEVKNPKFEISMDGMGIKNNKILITPTNFKGII